MGVGNLLCDGDVTGDCRPSFLISHVFSDGRLLPWFQIFGGIFGAMRKRYGRVWHDWPHEGVLRYVPKILNGLQPLV